MNFINDLFLQLLTYLTTLFNGNLGWAIIAFTLIIRGALIPITLPSLKSQKKMAALKPKLDELRQKHGHDKKLLSQKQLELYQQEGINPAAGCLPQIVQLVLLIILYQVLVKSLNPEQLNGVNVNFLWFNLTTPDPKFILPVLAGVTQLVLGVMLLPATSTKAEHQLAATTKTKKDDKQADDMTQMAASMQSQMVLMMPAFTFFLALRFPAGLALYWIVTTVFSLVQQYFLSGLGGLVPYLAKAGIVKTNAK